MIKNVWYDLNEIVRSKNIFVFRKALEEILQHAQTPKQPLIGFANQFQKGRIRYTKHSAINLTYFVGNVMKQTQE